MPQVTVRGSSGARTLTGAATSAGLLADTDIEACKGFLNAIDAVLLPYEPDTGAPYLVPLTLDAQCTGEVGLNYSGEVVGAGAWSLCSD